MPLPILPTTPITLRPESPASARVTTTWSAFCRDNADALSEADLAEIAEAISIPFGSYQLGGGATPVVHIMVETDR